MPEFEIVVENQYIGPEEGPKMTISPSEGDLRVQNDWLEEYTSSGYWMQLGTLRYDQICNDLSVLRSEVQIANDYIQNVETLERDRLAHEERSSWLEAQFDDLKEAGEYLREMRETKKGVEEGIKSMQAGYDRMSKQCKSKLDLWKLLEKDHRVIISDE